MKLIFKLRFHTNPGQSLWLTGNHEIFGGNDFQKAIALQYLNHEFWQVTVDLSDAVPDAAINYNYVLVNADGTLTFDAGRDKVINPSRFKSSEVFIIDSWNDTAFYENVFYTEPFRRVLLRREETAAPPEIPDATHTFNVKAPLLNPTETICLIGNSETLGWWSVSDPPLLHRAADADFFSIRLNLTRDSFPLEYKYGVYDLAAKKFVRFEQGDNRLLHDMVMADKTTVVNDGFARLPSTTWKGAGIAIPVFSLRSENSFGIGEFRDLRLLADWCRIAGLKLIQLLPVNDTTTTYAWTDSYPYSCISAFALHPIYLNLERMASDENRRLLKELEPERRRLNALESVDYESVLKAKLAFVKRIYPSQKVATFQSAEYQDFFVRNKQWLVPYAVFCFLRDKYGTADFSKWPDHRDCLSHEIAALGSPESKSHESIAVNFFIQFHLHQQLRDASDYAHSKGIILKGDIPIGVARHGADAWEHRELFHLDAQAGAPPDAFAAKGQNWGFPTYNWQRMKANGYAWWKQRFEQMSGYFDAFRIDHILGFFRIWSIPTHAVEGILGRFDRVIPVHGIEFPARGIRFDRDRFLNPFINDAVLTEIFGADASHVKDEFLEPDALGRLKLKPGFETQREIESAFEVREPSDRNRLLKQGLFDLITNVILLASDNSHEEFHFRFNMADTISFRNLDSFSQDQLRELYVDYFFRRQDDFWKQEALEKLPALKRATNMLVCGEDLGLVPRCVPEVMQRLGLLSLEIQRMPKADNEAFFDPSNAPYLSVVTPSTHDMSTVRGWWEEDRARTQLFFNEELQQPGDAPATCEPWIAELIFRQHIDSPAMWSIFQLQDLLAMDGALRRENHEDERINVPADPKHYWRYRMHMTLEKLIGADPFTTKIRAMLKKADRSDSHTLDFDRNV